MCNHVTNCFMWSSPNCISEEAAHSYCTRASTTSKNTLKRPTPEGEVSLCWCFSNLMSYVSMMDIFKRMIHPGVWRLPDFAIESSCCWSAWHSIVLCFSNMFFTLLLTNNFVRLVGTVRYVFFAVNLFSCANNISLWVVERGLHSKVSMNYSNSSFLYDTSSHLVLF